MAINHDFIAQIAWTGNRGEGTREYRGYDRTWELRTRDKPVVQCSNDPMLGGDPTKHNPEDLLLAALSACHMLWYLHLASSAGIVVTNYVDSPIGRGHTETSGAGRFVSAELRPTITVLRGTDLDLADALHHEVSKYCFIARSTNFPIHYSASYLERP